MSISLSCAFAIATAAAPAFGQPQIPSLTLAFEGGVTDAAGHDVPMADVVVTDPSGPPRRGTTNQLGQFGITGLLIPGVYTVTASEGTRSAADTVRVPPAGIGASRVQTYVVNLAFDGGSKVTGAYLIPIYFATSRKQIANSPPQFGEESGDQSKTLTFGLANVNMPLRHKVAEIARAPWERRMDADKHIAVTSGGALSTAQFAAQSHARGPTDDALVFVHGFNVLFQEGVETAAQVAYDIGFRGAVIVYSWPSGSASAANLPEMLRQYTFAQAQIDQGAEYVQLTSFLQDVLRAHKGRVHLLAHSMGAYLSVRAFAKLGGPKWTNIVFAAPDVSQPVFDAEAPHIVSLSRALVVYFNPNDRALQVSQMQNWQFPRTGASCTKYTSIECIDASSVRTSQTRHSYYADSRSILSDIRLVTCLDATPSRRGLNPTKVANAWVVSNIPAAQPKECRP